MSTWFRGVVGYHTSLTHLWSPVRARAKSCLLLLFPPQADAVRGTGEKKEEKKIGVAQGGSLFRLDIDGGRSQE